MDEDPDAECDFWLVGELAEVPPMPTLFAMKDKLDQLGLRVSDRVRSFRSIDWSRAPKPTWKSWSAALKNVQLGDVLADGGDHNEAGFQVVNRLFICRVPGDRPDGAAVAWELAAFLYDLWRPKEFFAILNIRPNEPHVLQFRDVYSRAAFVSGLYGYSWIVGASFDRYAQLAEDLMAAARVHPQIDVVTVDGFGVLARLRERPSLITEDDKVLWRGLLESWTKQSQEAPSPRHLVVGMTADVPWTIWSD
jgi:hypothetical protein